MQAEALWWYVREYGEVYGGQAENIVLIGVPADTPAFSEGIRSAQPNPLSMRLGAANIKERFLSEAVRAEMNIAGEADHFTPRDWHQVCCTLHLHDDWFAMVQPTNRTLLVRMVHATLKLHSFYLEQEIDWCPVLNPLTDLLETIEEFELVTDTDAQRVFVDWPHQIIRRKHGAHVKPYLAHLSINDGKASFQNLTNTKATP